MAGKKCSKCGEFKPLSAFRLQRNRKTRAGTPLADKPRAECKSCGNSASVKRKLRARARDSHWSWHSRLVDRWYEARRKGSDIGLEEYADYYETRQRGYHKKDCHIRPVKGRTDRRCKECGEASGRKEFCGEACRWRWKYRNVPAFNADERVRNQVKKYLKGEKGASSIIRELGYTNGRLAKHLESQFVDGMSWDNFGEWHIDHIIPKSYFGTSRWDVLACWSLENLRPLWAADNLARNRYPSFDTVCCVARALQPSYDPNNDRRYICAVLALNRNIANIRGYPYLGAA